MLFSHSNVAHSLNYASSDTFRDDWEVVYAQPVAAIKSTKRLSQGRQPYICHGAISVEPKPVVMEQLLQLFPICHCVP